ncbi:MAG TPA: hypothetical protein VGN34_04415 [Ktedonobacteraceae bacterium]
MRGKLRDKRATTRQDSVRRELAERRKPSKRDSRAGYWLNQESENEEDDLDLLEDNDDEDITIPRNK